MVTVRAAAVIPCFNTSRACAPVIAGVAREGLEPLAVDDGSTDDTARALAETGCAVLTLTPNRGKGAALAAGFRALLARADAPAAVMVIDGDGQHDPRDVPRFLAAAAGGAALVVGVRDPRAMPRRNRIGNHYARLMFLIGTGRYVADTQCGFRLLSTPLLRRLLDRVTWTGYEAESEVLRHALAADVPIAAVPVATIYIDGNRASRFHAWRDSARIARVFAPQIGWTIGTAWFDIAVFAALVTSGAVGPLAANVLSRLVAVGAQLALRPDGMGRVKRLAAEQGAATGLAAFAGHLALSTAGLALLRAIGAPTIVAKVAAQLAAYLVGFAFADRVMFARATRGDAARPDAASDPAVTTG